MKKYRRSFSSRGGVRDMVNTREIASEYRLTHWAQVLQERAQSGLTIKVYCKQIGISTNTYFYWQRRVHVAAANEMGLCVCKEAQPPQVSFSAVRVVGAAACPTAMETGAPGQLHIDTGGVQLTADSTYPVEQLAQLVHALKRSC